MKFQEELFNSSAFSVNEIIKDHKYTIVKNYFFKNAEFWKDKFIIEVDRIKQEFKCECCKLQRDGLVCCHILRLFTQFGINKLPDSCINGRWTKTYREEELEKQKKKCIEDPGCTKAQKAIRYAMVNNKLTAIWSDICNNAAQSKEFLEELERFHEKMLKEKEGTHQEVEKQNALKDPPIGEGKSVPKGKRMKHPIEPTMEEKKKKGKGKGTRKVDGIDKVFRSCICYSIMIMLRYLI